MSDVGPMRVAIVGVGKIARDQHIPAIAAEPDVRLVAAASHVGEAEGVPNFPSVEAMLEGAPEVEAVSVCTPPLARYGAALRAIEAGRHVFLEKPPGATLSEVAALSEAARRAGVTLFASWHSRYAPGVEPARDWLSGRSLKAVRVTWKEDVEFWHPGQSWIFQAGGLGVFDPGINALSILTHVLPAPFRLREAELGFPANRDAPIDAELGFVDAAGVEIAMSLDFRQKGPQTWDIEVETDDGRLTLSKGGAALAIDGRPVDLPPETEYRNLYRRFARLVRDGESDVDIAPFRHVADAFMLGRRRAVAPFEAF